VIRSRMRSQDDACVLTVDVEDWFHILDSPAIPGLSEWDSLELRVARNTESILGLLDDTGLKATFFWLGWCAERNPLLVRRCAELGHEIASHGYAHVLAYQVGRSGFAADTRKGRAVIEDIIGREVIGFRAAGFGATDDTDWLFEEIRAAGYTYDSSVFPARRGHGGMANSQLESHIIKTEAGNLVEIPQSVVSIFGKRISLFGGGYLRLAPRWLIRWGISKLETAGRPLVIYVHPREVDPHHPRLPLSPIRRFKSYVNLRTTMPKLRWLCQNHRFQTMGELAASVSGRHGHERELQKST